MESLISQGLSLMIFGMGFVFVFLTLLVGVTMLMSKVAMKFEPVSVAAPSKAKRNRSAATVEAKNDELVAVITAAVHKYRS